MTHDQGSPGSSSLLMWQLIIFTFKAPKIKKNYKIQGGSFELNKNTLLKDELILTTI